MTYTELPVTFECRGESLVGILSRPESPLPIGIVIPVGGPQYRSGSHRQFTLMARHLAMGGYAVLRFDYRGMGDSSGEQIRFDDTGPDIAGAIDALFLNLPSLQRVVLWGLCDAASAALLYLDATADRRVGGLCLLNPWVRSENSLAKTQIKHYYGRRLLENDFWRKLLGGRLNVARAADEFARKLLLAGSKSAVSHTAADQLFSSKMARSWRAFSGPSLLVLSGDDYTAKEFLLHANGMPDWSGLLSAPHLTRVDLVSADHTFSSAEWRSQVEIACLDWLSAKFNRADPAPCHETSHHD